jgi:hypothetical protein
MGLVPIKWKRVFANQMVGNLVPGIDLVGTDMRGYPLRLT